MTFDMLVEDCKYTIFKTMADHNEIKTAITLSMTCKSYYKKYHKKIIGSAIKLDTQILDVLNNFTINYCSFGLDNVNFLNIQQTFIKIINRRHNYLDINKKIYLPLREKLNKLNIFSRTKIKIFHYEIYFTNYGITVKNRNFDDRFYR
jgi:hypothetical protein